jgi:hypothetical protein
MSERTLKEGVMDKGRLPGKVTKDYYVFRLDVFGKIQRMGRGSFQNISRKLLAFGWNYHSTPQAGLAADPQYEMVALARGVLAVTKFPYTMREGWTVLRVDTGEVVGWLVRRETLAFDAAVVEEMVKIVKDMRQEKSAEEFDISIKKIDRKHVLEGWRSSGGRRH